MWGWVGREVTADTIKHNKTYIHRLCQVLFTWEMQQHLTNLSKGSLVVVFYTDILYCSAEYTSVGLNVMMTPCWETHGRVAAVSWTQAGFTVGSIVAVRSLMASKQSHDGPVLPFYPTKNSLLHTLS